MKIWALFAWACVSGIHLLLRWQLPTVGWTACGLRACIVEKYVWFSAVLHVADESGSALVHGVASVTADRLAPKRVFGSLLFLALGQEGHPDRCTVWDVVTSCLESIIYFSATLACSSRLTMTTIQYASARVQNPRQIRGPQVQTLHRLPTSEVTS